MGERGIWKKRGREKRKGRGRPMKKEREKVKKRVKEMERGMKIRLRGSFARMREQNLERGEGERWYEYFISDYIP